MSEENKDIQEDKLPSGRVKVTVKSAFMYNGTFVKEGDVIDMNEERAVNHMRVGDLERDEALITRIKEKRAAAAKQLQDDAEGDW